MLTYDCKMKPLVPAAVTAAVMALQTASDCTVYEDMTIYGRSV